MAHQRSKFDWAIALHTVASAIHQVHHRVGLAPHEFGNVSIVNHRRNTTAHHREWARQPLDHLPHAGGHTRARVAPWVAAAVVSPHPTEVVELASIVQNTAAQRGSAASRVVFQRAGNQVVKACETLRPVDKIGY